VLNDRLLEKIGGIEGRAILELGAGNGYFAPLLLKRYSGQAPRRLVISDQSQALLDIAQGAFQLDGAEYMRLDVQDSFPFTVASFDIILASMLFNELTRSGLQHALRETHRVLATDGRLIAAVVHPTFVRALTKKDALTSFGHGLFAMPSGEGMRLPVARRSADSYLQLLAAASFHVGVEDVHPDDRTRHEKVGLKMPVATPLALLFDCVRL
jgi:ubiquinone/menaquinone biosynthesis C-methylase UbiE